MLTLLTMVNVVSFFQGYSFLYLFPKYPAFNDVLALITGPIFVICSTLLTRAFLNVRHFSKLLDNLLVGNMLLDVGVGLLMAIFFRQISYQYHNYLIFFHCLLALVSAGYCLHKKYNHKILSGRMVYCPRGGRYFYHQQYRFMPGYLSTNYMGLMAAAFCKCYLSPLHWATGGEHWN